MVTNDDERDRLITELRIDVAKLQGDMGRTKWWQIAGGVASILASTLAFFTLIAVLVNVGAP